MTHPNYRKGAVKERKILNQEKAKGNLGTRSSGSHGRWDLTIVDPANRKLHLIQCKPKDFSVLQKKRIMDENGFITGTYEVTFEVI